VRAERRVIAMGLGWIFRRLTSDSRHHLGLFGYLTSRDRNKTRIKLENARREATMDLIDHLPSGAMYREGTADGWREIWIPDLTSQPPLFVLPMDHCERAQDHHDPVELPQQPKALGQDDESAQ
jgi:hypothetical protein